VKKNNRIILLIFLVGILLSRFVDEENTFETTSKIQSGLFFKEANNVMLQDKIKNMVVKRIVMNENLSFNEAGFRLEEQTRKHLIDVMNWKSFDYVPKVEFRIGHTSKEIWLKYYVSEKYIRALEQKTNGDVYKDSCVEFFISLDDNHYYNFEFNCIGTKHVAYGTGRKERINVDPDILEKIRIRSSLGKHPFQERKGQHEWELLIAIPISCFVHSELKTFRKLKATANFYKCGDHTSLPHYLSWNTIHTGQPDFHQPDFFGSLYFE